ncbi:MAG TPA: ABC transporter permease [Candidatus Cloacimonetes bacterium]|nr:ABC transporter permease [Candidatus Cloacimonadota bacterium]
MNKVVGYFLKKYIFSPKKEWLRFDSIFMVVGIVISVATLTVALSIFEGYEKVLKKTILGVNSHIYIFNPGEGNLDKENIEQLSGFCEEQTEIESYAAIIMTQAMCTNEKRVKGCLLRGIDWRQENQPTSYKEYISEGRYELQNLNEAVIGYKLAKSLNLSIGDTLTLISPLNSQITPLGMKPQKQEFLVVGLYKSGMYEYDSKYVFMNYQSAAEFISAVNEYSMLEIKLSDENIERADYLAYRWSSELDHQFQITSWIDFNGNLFSLLKLEKWVIFIILSFLILIASFNVVSSVSTSIIEKKQDLGILKAFGASSRILKNIFIGKTFIISIFAVTFGQIFGVLIAIFLSKQTFFLLKGDVYFLEKINVSFNLLSWIIILLVSLLIISGASFIPLKKITKLDVTEILRS